MKNLLCFLLAVSMSLSAQVTQQTVRDMPANSWLHVPNTKIRALDPCPARDCSYSGVSGLLAVVFAWSGGAYDSKRDRLIVWGGGHNDYRGNEIYVFDVPTMKWVRFTEPSANPVNCGQTNSDGTPNSRHTWGGLEYIAHADRFFASGGALSCNAGGCGADKTWTFDFDAKQWTDRLPTGTRPPTGCGNACAYDPNSRRVFWGDNNYPGNGAGMYSYSYDNNSWSKHSATGFYDGAAVVDPKRKLLFFIGGQNNSVTVFDIGNNNYTPQVWSTTGGGGFTGNAEPGLAYDPVADKIVGWVGGSVYALNPDTRAWTAYNPSGAPNSHIGSAGNSTGINGRWRYISSLNAYIVVTSVDDDVYFYKLTDGGGTGADIAASIPAAGRLQVFPNPFASSVSFRAPLSVNPIDICLHDVRGARLAHWSIPPSADRNITWAPTKSNASKSAQQIILVSMRDGNKNEVRRLIHLD